MSEWETKQDLGSSLSIYVDVDQLKSTGCTFLLVDVDGRRQAPFFITPKVKVDFDIHKSGLGSI